MLHAITSGDFHGQIGPSSRMTNGNPSVTGHVLHVTGLTKSYRTAGEEVAVLRGVNLDGRRGRERRADGRIRQRQEHALAPDRRPRCRRWRRDQAGRCTGLRTQRCRARGIAPRPARPGVSAIQPDSESHGGRQSGFPVAHCRPSRRGLAPRTGGAARARQFPQTLSRAIVRRPATARRDRPGAGRKAAAAAWRTSRPAISTRTPRTRCWRWRAIW